jgi:copper chaperone
MTASAPTTYLVPGMSCEHCQRAIEGEVGAVAGVTGVEVDLAGQTVTVAGVAGEADVRAAIGRAGYETAPKGAE